MKPDQYVADFPQVTAAEMRLNLAALIAKVQQEPVALVYHRHCVGVMLSVSEYQRLAGTKPMPLSLKAKTGAG